MLNFSNKLYIFRRKKTFSRKMKNLMEYFEIYHLLIWNRQNLINFFDTHTVTWTLWVMFSLCQGQEWQEGKSLQAFVLCQMPMCMSIWQGPLARTNWASCLYKAREILFHALLLYVISECVMQCFNRFL
jgi:hypothetical protein